MILTNLMEEKHKKIVTDSTQMIHLNLDFLRDKDYNWIRNEKNKLMEDLYFLICGMDELENVYERVDKLMKDVIDESKKIAGLDKMGLYLTDEELFELDKKYYIEVGRDEEKQEMINNLYKKGVSLDIISEASGLSIDKVKKILKTK